MRLSEAAGIMDAELTGRDRGFHGCSTDSRTVTPDQLFFALRGGRFDGHNFLNQVAERGAAGAVVERSIGSVPLPLVTVHDTLRAMGELASGWRGRFEIPIVAITGSNGKTTVKEMVASILARQAPVHATCGNLNNEIGVPITLFGLDAAHHFAVVEMGANHRGEIRRLTGLARPTVAVITQCAPAHLEGFGSIEGVADAKAEIFLGLVSGGTAILNSDDRFFALWRERSSRFRQLTFALQNPAEVTAGNVQPRPEEACTRFLLVTPSGEIAVTLSLPGVHNVANALAAAACGEALGAPLDHIRAGLESVSPAKGRLEFKPGVQSSRILDDTYNANPASLRAALKVLQGMSGRRWLVLGDMGELGDSGSTLHLDAGESARECGVERLFTVGPLSRRAVDGFGTGARHFETVDELARAVRAGLDPDVTVLIKGSRAMAMERVVNALIAGD